VQNFAFGARKLF